MLPNFSGKSLLAAIGILLLTMLIYWPGLAGPFVLDDAQNIVKTHVADLDLNAIVYSVTHNTSGMLGRGVSIVSFMLTGIQYGLEPWGYKFHNLLIHLLCGILLWRLLYLLLTLIEPRQRSELPLIVAGLVSGLWLLHPLLVSTVLYVVQRMTQLATLFTLLALLTYVEVRRSTMSGSRFWLLGWLVFPLFLLLSMFSKETGVLIPVYVLTIEMLVFRTSLASLRDNRRFSAWLLTFVGLPLVLGGLYVLTHFAEMTNYSVRTFTLEERLMTQVHVLFMYARQILLPRIGGMSLFHDDFPVTQSLDATTLLLTCALVGALVLIWWARQRLPVLALGLAWFLVSHLLESTIIPLELVFEHRNYLASAGLLLPPIWYAFKLANANVFRWFIAAYSLVFSLQTFSRVQEWSSEAMMMTVAVADHPGSQRAHTLYANYLFSQDKLDLALAELRLAQKLKPQDAGPSLQLLMYNCVAGIRDEELITKAESQLRTFPVTPYALNALENLLAFHNRKICDVFTLDDFERLFTAALAMPNNTVNSMSHGFIKRFQGMHAFFKGQYAMGVIAMREAYESSKRVSMLAELVRYQISFNRVDDAEDTLDLIREANEASMGIEAYTLRSLEVFMAEARQSRQDGEDSVLDSPVSGGMPAEGTTP